MNKILLAIIAITLSACAHSVTITPSLRELSTDGTLAPEVVDYYISPANYEMVVTQKTGGGDSISYSPYRDLEPALQKVLFERFDEIERTSAPPTPQAMNASHAKYTFIPEFSSTASSESWWMWPPQKFRLKCSIRAVDASGKTVWSAKYQGVGTAKNEEWSTDFVIAAKRAAITVFQKMQKDLKAFAF